MKNISTGFGLALLAGAILAYPFVSSLAPSASASAVTAAASAVRTAATAQTGPTIVWYGMNDSTLGRAWSDGTIEVTHFTWRYGDFGDGCGYAYRLEKDTACSTWQVLSSPSQGYTYRSDINFDEQVNGADLGQLLADWGNAPRQDIPPSDCPLALINP